MDTFDYLAEVITPDGVSYQLNLEERGWATKDLFKINGAARFSLIPKDPAGPLPLVSIQVPVGAKPVFKSRTWMRNNEMVFRCYAIGFKKGRTVYWVWVLPNGTIETGDHPALADVLFAHLVANGLVIAPPIPEESTENGG